MDIKEITSEKFLKKWWKRYKLVFTEAYQIVAFTEKKCQSLSTLEIPFRDLTKQFAIPLLIAAGIMSFCGYWINSHTFKIEFGLLKSVFDFLSLSAGYFGSLALSFYFTRHLLSGESNKKTSEIIVSYSFSVFILVHMVMYIFPGLFFISFLSLYMLYVLWNFVPYFFQKSSEAQRRLFVLAMFLTMVLIPFITRHILRMLVPNVKF